MSRESHWKASGKGCDLRSHCPSSWTSSTIFLMMVVSTVSKSRLIYCLHRTGSNELRRGRMKVWKCQPLVLHRCERIYFILEVAGVVLQSYYIPCHRYVRKVVSNDCTKMSLYTFASRPAWRSSRAFHASRALVFAILFFVLSCSDPLLHFTL